MGRKPGTDGYLQCRLTIAQNARRRGATPSGGSASARRRDFKIPRRAITPMLRRRRLLRRPINCRSVRTGNVVNNPMLLGRVRPKRTKRHEASGTPDMARSCWAGLRGRQRGACKNALMCSKTNDQREAEDQRHLPAPWRAARNRPHVSMAWLGRPRSERPGPPASREGATRRAQQNPTMSGLGRNGMAYLGQTTQTPYGPRFQLLLTACRGCKPG